MTYEDESGDEKTGMTGDRFNAVDFAGQEKKDAPEGEKTTEGDAIAPHANDASQEEKTFQ